jgi:hypothetical protein
VSTERATWPPASFDDILRFLQHPRIECGSSSWISVALPWELAPKQYLAFARTDLNQRGPRGRVNALGNAKRALHGQIDSILYCAGLWDLARKRRWDFPTKTALLQDLQIVAPAVLSRVNRLRNHVEHEYSIPGDLDRLVDFVDVVELFTSATERFASGRHDDLEFIRPYRSTEHWIALRHDRPEDHLVIRAQGRGEVVRLDPSDERYPQLLRAKLLAARRTGAPS